MRLQVIPQKDGSFILSGDGHQIRLTREQAVTLRDVLTLKLKTARI